MHVIGMGNAYRILVRDPLRERVSQRTETETRGYFNGS
jgi:hypothetical protein